MTRYTIDGEYLYTSDVRVASEFAGKDCTAWVYDNFSRAYETVHTVSHLLCYMHQKGKVKMKLRKADVREVCEAKEGAIHVAWNDTFPAELPPTLSVSTEQGRGIRWYFLRANALTVTTCGELRELHAWIHEEA